MEAVNSFVMSWWPVFAGIFGVMVLLAQLWSAGQRSEQNALHERANQQDERMHIQDSKIDKFADELHAFQLYSRDKFVTADDLGRIVSSIDSMKADLTRWLERLDNSVQNKADK